MKKIRKIMCLFAVTLMLGNTFHGIVNAEEFMLGDVNGDGGITAEDALGILKNVVGIEQDVFNADMADCDGDSRITANDALKILKYVVGIITDVSQDESHEHHYTWTHVSDGDYKVNKCSCGQETGERAYNLGNGVYGQWKDSMASDLMTWTNLQRGNSTTTPVDAIGNHIGIIVSPPLNDNLSSQAKSRALACVYDYGHNNMLTEDECLAQGYDNARSVSSAWMESSDHRSAMCDYNYIQGGTACLWYDTDGNGTMSYIWVLVLDRDSSYDSEVPPNAMGQETNWEYIDSTHRTKTMYDGTVINEEKITYNGQSLWGWFDYSAASAMNNAINNRLILNGLSPFNINESYIEKAKLEAFICASYRIPDTTYYAYLGCLPNVENDIKQIKLCDGANTDNYIMCFVRDCYQRDESIIYGQYWRIYFGTYYASGI